MSQGRKATSDHTSVQTNRKTEIDVKKEGLRERTGERTGRERKENRERGCCSVQKRIGVLIDFFN